MFWNKKDQPETKDDGSHIARVDEQFEINQMESIINDILDDGKKKSDTLRDKASSRAEALELHKFPVSILVKNIAKTNLIYFFFIQTNTNMMILLLFNIEGNVMCNST
jgi:hypothetical protein